MNDDDDEPAPGEIVPSPKKKSKVPTYHIPDVIKQFLPEELNTKTLTDLQLDIMIIELKKCGWSLDHISYFTSISRKQIVKRLRRYVRRAARAMFTSVEEYVTHEELRLDDLRRALQPKIDRGDIRAIEADLKIMDHLAKLKGLYCPERKEIKQRVDVHMEQKSLAELRLIAIQQGIQVEPELQDFFPLPGEEVPEAAEFKVIEEPPS